ncbi:MAG TPA: NUDIX domain-containing protein [Chlamydiales bacterium]|nr:NUDIX domain-containing protein [Chlamydiales bacterium]
MTVNNIKSVAGVIFSQDRNSVLLVKRRDVPVWVLPGGGIDRDESSENAVIREILEETGFTVKIDRLIALYLPTNKLAKATHLYECLIENGSPQISSETLDIQFFPLDHLPKLIPPPFRDWIFDAHKMQPFFQKKIEGVTYPFLLLNLLRHPTLVLRFIYSKIKYKVIILVANI